MMMIIIMIMREAWSDVNHCFHNAVSKVALNSIVTISLHIEIFRILKGGDEISSGTDQHVKMCLGIGLGLRISLGMPENLGYLQWCQHYHQTSCAKILLPVHIQLVV